MEGSFLIAPELPPRFEERGGTNIGSHQGLKDRAAPLAGVRPGDILGFVPFLVLAGVLFFFHPQVRQIFDFDEDGGLRLPPSLPPRAIRAWERERRGRGFRLVAARNEGEERPSSRRPS